MTAQDPMATATRLVAQMEALAAFAAHLRVEAEGLDVDPECRTLLAQIAHELVGDATVPTPMARAIAGMTGMLLGQSAQLVAEPGRPGGWQHTDPAVLQGAGRISMPIAGVIREIAPQLDGLADRLAAPGSAILDIGTGTAWLAIALAEAFPEARVVGIDVHEPALVLARANVAASAVARRVEVRTADALTLDEADTYDAIWIPLPFIPRTAVPGVIAAAVRALKPGGWLLPGGFAGPPDRLAELLVALRTVRSGGHPWTRDEMSAEMAGAGLVDVGEVPRTWEAPVRLFAGRRPER